MTIETELLDLCNTRSAIRFEYKTKYLRYEIVEFFACPRIGELGTFGTRSDLFFNTARAHLTPGSL